VGKLTSAERRQVFLARERARRAVFARTSTGSQVDIDCPRAGHRLRTLVMAATIVVLIVGGVVAHEFVEFHPPAPILVEVLMPRL
jgi:hypothetical protein